MMIRTVMVSLAALAFLSTPSVAEEPDLTVRLRKYSDTIDNLFIEWSQAYSWLEGGTLWRYDSSRLARCENGEKLSTHSLPDARLGAPKRPDGLPGEAWWDALQRKLDGIKKTFVLFDGRRQATFSPWKRQGQRAGYFGIREVRRQPIATFPHPLRGNYYAYVGMPLLKALDEFQTVDVTATWGARLIIGSNHDSATCWLWILSEDNRLPPSECLIFRSTTIGEVERIVSASATAEALRSSAKVSRRLRTHSWMDTPGGVPIPRLVTDRIMRRPHDDPREKDALHVIRVDSARRLRDGEVAAMGSEKIPSELQSTTVDVIDRLKKTLTRYHPDGRVELIRDTLPEKKRIVPVQPQPGGQSGGTGSMLFRWAVIGIGLGLCLVAVATRRSQRRSVGASRLEA